MEFISEIQSKTKRQLTPAENRANQTIDQAQFFELILLFILLPWLRQERKRTTSSDPDNDEQTACTMLFV